MPSGCWSEVRPTLSSEGLSIFEAIILNMPVGSLYLWGCRSSLTNFNLAWILLFVAPIGMLLAGGGRGGGLWTDILAVDSFG